MQHLRLVGVHEDGLHLLLADDGGERYAVPLDEPLRAAVRRDRPRLGQLQIEMTGGLRPRDVQAMIRAGMSTEEVAERAGWPVEKVHRYEGPILAEREHVAGMARQVRLRPRGGSAGAAPTLEARVLDRLRSRALDVGSARWDSRRSDHGAWTVLLVFHAGGQEREATWQFDPLARTVTASDDEARWLSEDEDQQAPGPIPAPHLSASSRPNRVYDVEAEGGLGLPTRHSEAETVDLMAAMRERSAQRGRRRRPKGAEVPGIENAPEDALPLEELAKDPREEVPPPAHTHPEDDPEITKEGPAERRIGADAAARKARRAEPTQPVRQSRSAPERPAGRRRNGASAPTAKERHPQPDPEPREAPSATDDDSFDPSDLAVLADLADLTDVPDAPANGRATGPTSVTRATGAAGASDADEDLTDVSDLADGTDGELVDQRVPARAKPASTRRSGRPSVPSWDDIMFGRRD
ncbi:septation protein SepH [Intrasporangium mesophilum]